MASTQAADVSKYPSMDSPHDNDPVTFGMVLKYMGMLFAALFTFIAAWVGKRIFGYVSTKLEGDMKEVKETMHQIKDVVSQMESLQKADAEIKIEINEIKNRLAKLEQRIK